MPELLYQVSVQHALSCVKDEWMLASILYVLSNLLKSPMDLHKTHTQKIKVIFVLYIVTVSNCAGGAVTRVIIVPQCIPLGCVYHH